jgi:cytochrome b subunit of formate dehydrogenase
MFLLGGVILYRTGTANFEPWEQARCRLVLAAILVAGPGYAFALHLFPLPLAIALSLLFTPLLVLNFIVIVPDQWRRMVKRRE